MSEYNSPKEGFSDQEELIQTNRENQEEYKNQINTLLIMEEYEKALNTIFDPYQNICESNEEEIIHPIIYNVLNDNKSNKNWTEEEEKEKDIFPFTEGIGLKNTLGENGLLINYKTPSQVKLSRDETNKSYDGPMFAIRKYYINEKGEKRKKGKSKKYMAKNIRKKIKASFHKAIKNIINERIKKAGAKKTFKNFPQCFVTDISKKSNNEALYLTYEQLIEKSYIPKISSKGKLKGADLKNFNQNMEVLKYLRENLEISEKSEFEIIKNMKYHEILEAFFMSKEFEETLITLCINRKEPINYIEKFIKIALTYVDCFANYKNDKNISSNLSYDEEEEEEEDEEEEDKENGYE